jgi:cellulose biosynthesis protein BcsQ
MPNVLMYSFKGGAGRTVSTANIGYFLATTLGKRVCIVDLDVESAGASVLFDADDSVESSSAHYALQDILSRAQTDGILHPANFPDVWQRSARYYESLDNLALLPARRTLRRAEEAVFGTQSAARDFERLLLRIERHWRPDITLMDSASGIQQTALLGLENADVLVIFLRWTRQFLSGTRQFMKDQLVSNPDGWPRLRSVLVVPTAVPTADTNHARAELQRRTRDLESDIALLNHDARDNLGKPDGWISLGPSIPETYELKWDDRIFRQPEYDRSPDLRQLANAYGTLARLLWSQIEDAQ